MQSRLAVKYYFHFSFCLPAIRLWATFPAMNEKNPVSVYLATIGARGGRVMSDKKKAAIAKNLIKANVGRKCAKK